MSESSPGILNEKTRANLSIGGIFALAVGFVLATWQMAEVKSSFELRLTKIEIAVERFSATASDRYTEQDAAKDWRTQAIVNKRNADDVADLKSRLRALEASRGQ